MSLTSSRPNWTAAFEENLFNKVAAAYAPHIPPAREAEPRAPETAEEFAAIAEYSARLAAHDTFIVEACAKAIHHLDIDTDFLLKLARQIGDDGHHAVLARARLLDLTGEDQIDLISEYVGQHWAALGDLPYRDWFGFLAFQFHYELHIQSRLKIESRTARIRYSDEHGKKFRSAYAAEDEAGDELVHRIAIVEWVQKKFSSLRSAEKTEWIDRLLSADDEVQFKLNPYLRYRVENGAAAWQADTRDNVKVYDGHRREVLSYLLEMPVDRLPKLASLAD